ncbi:MAG: invasion associated locus B family protein [Rhizobiales bacterium]|nr:invasion associated locus B family protein [Hyphomicrobiales bacterium]
MAAAGILTAAALFVAPAALAQTPPKQPAKPAAPKQPPAAQQAPQQQQPPGGVQLNRAPALPPLIYSSWVKLCQSGPETGGKQACVIRNDGRLPDGMPVLLAQFTEVEGQEKTIQLILPFPVLVGYGTRILIDEQEVGRAPYVICAPQNGCATFYKADGDIIGRFKKGKMLSVEVIGAANEIVSLPLPLGDFAKAYDGPATDPKAFEEQQRKLQEGLQKKAADELKKLQSQQPTTPAATGSATAS